MNLALWIFLFALCEYHSTTVQAQQGQRVAPGVPPSHYQPPPVPPHQQQQMQQQQVPQQQQQQQQQYQQVPVHQQQQQHVPLQQVPVQNVQQVPVQPVQQQGHGHGHGHDHGMPQQVLNTANIAQEKAHIAEHLEVPMDTSKMSDQELQFHYFKMHDADNNNKLDGCELIKSLIHWHEPDEEGHTDGTKLYDDSELETLVNLAYNDMDRNNDGFIDWAEYSLSK